MKRIITVLLIVLMLICCANITAFAITPSPGDTLSINDDAVQITQAGTYTINGSGETTNIIWVAPNIQGDVNITLNNVNINIATAINYCAFTIGSGTTVNLTLEGTNIFISGKDRAGIYVPVGAELTIGGTGSLSATSGENAAGIGGHHNSGAGKITITGGSVTATSIEDGAGIGGGWNASGGVVTISGGTVFATSNRKGAGIGSGNGSSHVCTGGTITIEGSADVTARGGFQGAGIGGGDNSIGGNITIKGGKVTAIGGDTAAGIGGGYERDGRNIIISGGTVTATGGLNGAGIGGGLSGEGGNIKISGGIVTANGGKQGAGIGGGCQGIGGSIDIYGGEIYATGGPRDSTSAINQPGHDIGDGAHAISSEKTYFRLSGTAAAFMRSGACVIPVHHDFKIECKTTSELEARYGYNHFPASWGNVNVFGYIYSTVYYYVDFAPQNGSSIDAQAVNQGSKATKPNGVLKDGFIFAGWYSDAACNEDDQWDFDTDTIEKPTTLYAKWIPAYTVAFNSLGGSPVNSQTIGEGSKATKPTNPVKGDKRFGEWYTSSDCKDDELWDFDVDTVSTDITLYAKWTDIPTYTITFDSGSGSAVDSQTVTEGGNAAKPSDPTQSGYTFGGWYTSNSFNDDDRWNFTSCTVAKDMTLYAKWIAIPVTQTYTVTFDTKGGSDVGSQTVEDGGNTTKPSNPTRSGYTFGGWYTSNTCHDDDRWNFTSCTVAKDTTLYAKWTAIPATPTYTVIFDAKGGSDVGSQTVEDGDNATKPGDPTRQGYTFGGWYTSSNCSDDDRWNFNVCPVSQDVTLFAKWTAVSQVSSYTVSFNAQGGSSVSGQTVVEDEKVLKPSNPTQSGYIFSGWYTNSNCSDDDRWNFNVCPITEDITLYAKWTDNTQMPSYSVTFDPQGGSGISSQTVEQGKRVSKPSVPLRSGYTFGGWYTDSGCHYDDGWNFNICPVSKDTTLYAKWTPVSQEATPSETSEPTDAHPAAQEEHTTEQSDESKDTITPTVIKENENTGMTTVEIDIDALPEGTKQIELPSGETILIKAGSHTVHIEIRSEDIDKSGALTIVPINEEGIPLGTYNIEVTDEPATIDAEKGWLTISSALLWILIAASVLAGATLLFILLKKKK